MPSPRHANPWYGLSISDPLSSLTRLLFLSVTARSHSLQQLGRSPTDLQGGLSQIREASLNAKKCGCGLIGYFHPSSIISHFLKVFANRHKCHPLRYVLNCTPLPPLILCPSLIVICPCPRPRSPQRPPVSWRFLHRTPERERQLRSGPSGLYPEVIPVYPNCTSTDDPNNSVRIGLGHPVQCTIP